MNCKTVLFSVNTISKYIQGQIHREFNRLQPHHPPSLHPCHIFYLIALSNSPDSTLPFLLNPDKLPPFLTNSASGILSLVSKILYKKNVIKFDDWSQSRGSVVLTRNISFS